MTKSNRCEQCGTPYVKTVEWQRYCSKKCGNRAAQKRLRQRAKADFQTHTTRDSFFAGMKADDVQFMQNLEKRSMSSWSENELKRYNKLTGQEQGQ